MYDRTGRILTRDFSATGFVESDVWFRDRRGRPLTRHVVQVNGTLLRTDIYYAYAA